MRMALLVAQARMGCLPAALIDPIIGSGTLCIEAALMAADIAPILIRMRAGSKALQDKATVLAGLRWKNSDITLWRNLCKEAQVHRQKGLQWLLGRNPVTGNQNCHILGNDAHKGAYRLASQCRQEVDLPKSAIEFHNVDCQEWKIAGHIVEGWTIVLVNPPLGLCLDNDTERSWVALKSFL
jgi:23S rRNA G2445 N2-methylase RlmL